MRILLYVHIKEATRKKNIAKDGSPLKYHANFVPEILVFNN